MHDTGILWFKSYLENWRQRTIIWHNELGKPFPNRATINSGVPHCSILDPQLILLYINDLPLGININSNLLLYTDDTSVLSSGTSIDEFQTKSILHWIILKKMVHKKWFVLKPKKTKIIKPDSNYKVMNIQIFS
jgi:hypothetical protein